MQARADEIPSSLVSRYGLPEARARIFQTAQTTPNAPNPMNASGLSRGPGWSSVPQPNTIIAPLIRHTKTQPAIKGAHVVFDDDFFGHLTTLFFQRKGRHGWKRAFAMIAAHKAAIGVEDAGLPFPLLIG